MKFTSLTVQMVSWIALGVSCAVLGCNGTDQKSTDSRNPDTRDHSTIDTSVGSSDTDTGSLASDSGTNDTGTNDTGTNDTGTNDTGTNDTGTNDTGHPDLPGGIYSSTVSLPDGEPTCCEHEWTIRILHYHPGATVPRRMYFASCDTSSSAPAMFVSLGLGENAPHPTEDPSSGAILKTQLNASTGQLELKVGKRFPECVWMEGIAVSSDCNTIAALCRRRFGDDDFDFDSLATHAAKDWMTQPDCAAHEMWLYEWTNGDIESSPKKYVVHRAVGTEWEYGNNYIRIGESDNTYGIGVKARVFGGGGCHEADAFLVMDRSNHHLTSRGYSWACGTGHTLFNHPTFNSATQKYALQCGTDGSNHGSPLGGFFLRIEDRNANEFYFTNYHGLRIKGGVGALRPLDDGGYLGILVGVDASVTPVSSIPLEPPTSIGLVRFDSTGALSGNINWVVQAQRKYLSYPQLAPLGNGRYLLGWGEMYDLDRIDEMNDQAYRIPLDYYVMEIDEAGVAQTSALRLDGVGWGEQDEWIPLGNGRVGWAYIPSPALVDIHAPPSCNSESLQLSVYKAAQ